jgi:hypothetical protein
MAPKTGETPVVERTLEDVWHAACDAALRDAISPAAQYTLVHDAIEAEAKAMLLEGDAEYNAIIERLDADDIREDEESALEHRMLEMEDQQIRRIVNEQRFGNVMNAVLYDVTGDARCCILNTGHRELNAIAQMCKKGAA